MYDEGCGFVIRNFQKTFQNFINVILKAARESVGRSRRVIAYEQYRMAGGTTFRFGDMETVGKPSVAGFLSHLY